jgi:hypothetical protein
MTNPTAVVDGQKIIVIATLALAALVAIMPSFAHAGGLDILKDVWESCTVTVTVSCSGGGNAK